MILPTRFPIKLGICMRLKLCHDNESDMCTGFSWLFIHLYKKQCACLCRNNNSYFNFLQTEIFRTKVHIWAFLYINFLSTEKGTMSLISVSEKTLLPKRVHIMGIYRISNCKYNYHIECAVPLMPRSNAITIDWWTSNLVHNVKRCFGVRCLSPPTAGLKYL